MESILRYIREHRQAFFNVFLFIVLGQYVVRETQVDGIFKYPSLIEITFFVHNMIFLAVILLRREYLKLDTNRIHWFVAIASFFSGLFFIKSSISEGGIIKIADMINIAAIVVGILALVSLGRSFGIVPAVRTVRTGGLYRIIRHPMFVSDILFKIPIVLKYLTLYNSAVLVLSIVLYVLRAKYEEEILAETNEYSVYMQNVKYRFIPYLY